MKTLYKAIVNVLIFFFVIDLFGSIIAIGNGTFYEKMIYAVIFAGLMYVTPHILMFCKIPVSEISEFLVGTLLSFLFLFLGYYLLGFVTVTNYIFDPKIPLLAPVNLADKSIALMVIGALLALLSVGIQSLNSKKRRSSSYSSSY